MKKILIIEDDPSVRDNIADILELTDDYAFSVETAENGQDGLKRATESCPDLIICDVMMPGLNGYEVLQALRQQESTSNIPLVFLTAKVERDDQRLGMELGADDYLTKPFTAKELLKAIIARLNKRDAMEKRVQHHLDHLRSSITLSLPHEVYTPLNGILAFCEFFLTHYDSIDRDEGREILESIQTSGKRLQRLVQNFLLYAQLEVTVHDPERLNGLQNDRTHAPISALIRDLTIPLAEKLNRAQDLTLKLEESFGWVSVSMLQKILDELLDNAFKFSERGTSIVIESKIQDDQLAIALTNYGRGMTADQIANIGAYTQFERCFHEQQGSGLGLAIAKRMAELQGGSLTIDSVPQDYTRVCLKLPVAEPPEVSAAREMLDSENE
ncbi:MAG: hybrid sensor histidine kinase/response regulator [Leptolyngbya sp. DLM2.Bin15]|nr:MAG: hybrid sensor histidine kinase/response regulator [Leptolyngbya sp. DLM2.Bin15]